jgi:hypothetical protein
MNRRDLIFFGLVAAALGSVLLLNRKSVAPIIGRIGSTISIGSDPAAIAAAIKEASPAAATPTAAPTPPPGAQLMGNQWYVWQFRNLVPWTPPAVIPNP